MERGLRCCYHGWTYDIDGRCLETPGEPAHSQLRGTIVQGAYPVREVDKLIFAYMGPPDEQPEMPVWDTQTQPNSEVEPFSILFDCNWLQTHENGIDPIHAVFLHARPGRESFGDVFYTLPRFDVVETSYGACAQTTRRVGDHIWTRMVDLALPNAAHIPVPWVDANQVQFYTHAGVLRWCVPIDNARVICLSDGVISTTAMTPNESAIPRVAARTWSIFQVRNANVVTGIARSNQVTMKRRSARGRLPYMMLKTWAQPTRALLRFAGCYAAPFSNSPPAILCSGRNRAAPMAASVRKVTIPSFLRQQRRMTVATTIMSPPSPKSRGMWRSKRPAWRTKQERNSSSKRYKARWQLLAMSKRRSSWMMY